MTFYIDVNTLLLTMIIVVQIALMIAIWQDNGRKHEE